jgi:hypothetical protein
MSFFPCGIHTKSVFQKYEEAGCLGKYSLHLYYIIFVAGAASQTD